MSRRTKGKTPGRKRSLVAGAPEGADHFSTASLIGANLTPLVGVLFFGWDAATDFCRKLSAKTGKAVRLPTEAEWEYACRAGSTTRFCFGDVDEGLADYGWSLDNGRGKTQPVGQKKPNAWGLYDMHGNVSEWCADWYGEYPNGPVTDPQGPAAGYDRVLRGGCVYFNSYNCRAAYRNKCAPGDGTSENGIRVVVSVSR